MITRKKCRDSAKLCYMERDKMVDIYLDLAGNTETTFDTSNYEFERQLPTAKKLERVRINEYWHDHEKKKWRDSAKLRHKETDSFVGNRKLKEVYVDLVENVETIFDTLNYELKRPLPTEKIRK